jgi:hypothetical protein
MGACLGGGEILLRSLPDQSESRLKVSLAMGAFGYGASRLQQGGA